MNISRNTRLFLFCFLPLVFVNTSVLSEPPNILKTTNITHKVNLNSASVESLSSLKGIGQAKALAIVNYRKSVGHFKSVEDLLNVKGIGEKILMDNQSRIEI